MPGPPSLEAATRRDRFDKASRFCYRQSAGINTEGDRNTVIGTGALDTNIDDDDNTAIVYSAGSNIPVAATPASAQA
jgi:hypothetical protein